MQICRSVETAIIALILPITEVTKVARYVEFQAFIPSNSPN